MYKYPFFLYIFLLLLKMMGVSFMATAGWFIVLAWYPVYAIVLFAIGLMSAYGLYKAAIGKNGQKYRSWMAAYRKNKYK